MSALPFLAAAGLAGATVLLGSRLAALLARPEDSAAYRAVLYLMSGCTAFHLGLGLLDAAGVPWHPLVIAGLLALLFALAIRFLPRAAERTRLWSDWGWGDGAALFVLLVFTLFALSLWITLPDFVYHWGLKGHRFFLERGIDYGYLARGWNWVTHPDYPNLLPELYAATALLGGGFREPPMMLWSTVWFAAILLASRETLRRHAPGRFVRQGTLALVALAIGLFAIGHTQAGGADWMITLALVAALPPLLAAPSRETDLQIGVIAAFAAASKVEGVTLAALLIGIQLVRRVLPVRPWPLRRLWPGWRSLGRLALPAAVVVVPWLAAVRHFHLFQEFNAGRFDLERAAVIGPALLSSSSVPAWHGLPFLLPVLLPLLALDRRLRPAAAAIALQLLFYLYVYFTAEVGTQFLVESSFPRLVLHLLPAVLVGAAVMGGPPSDRAAA